MSLRKKLLPTFNGVASAGTATVDLPIGLLYHVIWIKIGYDAANASKETAGSAANQIVGDIRVKINGKVQRTFSAKELNSMNSANGSQFALKTSGTMGSTGYREYIPIFLAEPWREDVREQVLPAWNVNGVRSFQIEVDVKTITSPIVMGYYEFEPSAGGEIGTITKVIRQTFAVNGTQIDLNTIDRRDYLQCLHLFSTSDGKYVTKVKFTANSTEIQDLIDYLDNRSINLSRGLNPDVTAAPRFDLILDYDDRIGSALPLNGLNELTLALTFDGATAGTIVVLLVRAGPPE
jgi:coat protein